MGKILDAQGRMHGSMVVEECGDEGGKRRGINAASS
jgi:hypothetical protein